jgi:hypothetical protein
VHTVQAVISCSNYNGAAAAEVGAGTFFALSRSRARNKKSECAERERKKSVNLRFFLSPTLEARLQTPMMLGMGKSKGLE